MPQPPASGWQDARRVKALPFGDCERGGCRACAHLGRAATTVVLCCLAAIAEGFDIQSMGVAAPGMAPALHLTRDQLGPAFSASTVGLLIGAIVIGRLADRFGRRWSLIGSLAVFGVFTLATPLAGGIDSLLAIRLLAGLGLGGAMPNLIALASEAVTPRRQASFVAISAATLPLGGSLASAVAAGLPWRAIFEVGGALPLVLAGLMLAWLPESQRFIAARVGAAGAAPRTSLPEVFFGSGRALASVMLWASAFSALLLLFLLLNWLPTLMGAKGVSKSEASLVSLLFNIGGCLGGLAIAGLYTRPRRAAILAIWFAGSALALAALAYAPGALSAAGAAGLMAGFFISSAPTALYALAPDYYAVAMRGTGLGGVIGVGRIGAIIGPLLAGALLVGGKDARGVLLALLPFAAIGAAAALTALARRPTHPVAG